MAGVVRSRSRENSSVSFVASGIGAQEGFRESRYGDLMRLCQIYHVKPGGQYEVARYLLIQLLNQSLYHRAMTSSDLDIMIGAIYQVLSKHYVGGFFGWFNFSKLQTEYLAPWSLSYQKRTVLPPTRLRLDLLGLAKLFSKPISKQDEFYFILWRKLFSRMAKADLTEDKLELWAHMVLKVMRGAFWMGPSEIDPRFRFEGDRYVFPMAVGWSTELIHQLPSYLLDRAHLLLPDQETYRTAADSLGNLLDEIHHAREPAKPLEDFAALETRLAESELARVNLRKTVVTLGQMLGGLGFVDDGGGLDLDRLARYLEVAYDGIASDLEDPGWVCEQAGKLVMAMPKGSVSRTSSSFLFSQANGGAGMEKEANRDSNAELFRQCEVLASWLEASKQSDLKLAVE